jgi:hypothetical protein
MEIARKAGKMAKATGESKKPSVPQQVGPIDWSNRRERPIVH